MEGEFSCQARNIAGLGNKCNIKVSGPVSTLMAEADISVVTNADFDTNTNNIR